MMETWVAILLVALTAFMFGAVVALSVAAVVARSWLGLRPPKREPKPVAAGELHQATSPKVVKSA